MDSFLCGQRVDEQQQPPGPPGGRAKRWKQSSGGKGGRKAAVINELDHVVWPSPGRHLHHTPKT